MEHLWENAELGDARDGAVEQRVLGSNKQAKGMLSIGYILNLKVVQNTPKPVLFFHTVEQLRYSTALTDVRELESAHKMDKNGAHK